MKKFTIEVDEGSLKRLRSNLRREIPENELCNVSNETILAGAIEAAIAIPSERQIAWLVGWINCSVGLE